MTDCVCSSIHPPAEVSINLNDNISLTVPFTDSPLSSAPSSPRHQSEKLWNDGDSGDDEEDDAKINNAVVLEMPDIFTKRSSDGPFDENVASSGRPQGSDNGQGEHPSTDKEDEREDLPSLRKVPRRRTSNDDISPSSVLLRLLSNTSKQGSVPSTPLAFEDEGLENKNCSSTENQDLPHDERLPVSVSLLTVPTLERESTPRGDTVDPNSLKNGISPPAKELRDGLDQDELMTPIDKPKVSDVCTSQAKIIPCVDDDPMLPKIRKVPIIVTKKTSIKGILYDTPVETSSLDGGPSDEGEDEFFECRSTPTKPVKNDKLPLATVATPLDEPPSLRHATHEGEPPSLSRLAQSLVSKDPSEITRAQSMTAIAEDSPDIGVGKHSQLNGSDGDMLLASASPAQSSLGNAAESSDMREGPIRDLTIMVKGLEAVVTTQRKNLLKKASLQSIDQNESYLSRRNDNSELLSKLLSNGKPVLVRSINNDIGIPKGGIMISLLNENAKKTWSTRVQEAIWRGRTMRRNCDTRWLMKEMNSKSGSPSRTKTSVSPDADKVRIGAGILIVSNAQAAALDHLKDDNFDDALALYEDIILSYHKYFDEILRGSSKSASSPIMEENVEDFKRCVGEALNNIGIIHLLRGESAIAHTYFERAALNRELIHKKGTSDHISSLVMAAISQIAQGDLEGAKVELRIARELSEKNKETISDYRQLAEILNTMGCLSFEFGQIKEAKDFFQKSLTVQEIVSEKSLYAGSKFSCQSAALNMSITRANIGFIALTEKNVSLCVESLELAVREQFLLLKDAHATLISSMEYLVMANLLAAKQEKALQMLQRMLHMQLDAFGPEDVRVRVTEDKISSLRLEQQGCNTKEGDEITGGNSQTNNQNP